MKLIIFFIFLTNAFIPKIYKFLFFLRFLKHFSSIFFLLILYFSLTVFNLYSENFRVGSYKYYKKIKMESNIEKSNFFLIIKPNKNTQPLAINALTEIAAAQSNACTTRNSNKKDTPQSMERIENFVVISAFI